MSLAESASITSGQLHHPSPTAATTSKPDEAPATGAVGPSTEDEKSKKRSIFNLGKKMKGSDVPQAPPSPPRSTPGSPPLGRDLSKLSSAPSRTTASPPNEFYVTYPSSPTRGMSSSPRLSSPARSQIFERDVQDSVAAPTSPAIPSHIQTENHIPAVLNASSEVVTDDHIDPDSVEILTHSSHLPASVTVTGVAPCPTYEQMASSWAEELASFADPDRDDVSNFSPLDSSAGDIRRLSFISFADVVQAEQGTHSGGGGPGSNRNSIHLAGLTSLSNLHRSPSPIRSPVSSQGGGPGASAPTSNPGSVKGLDMSPARKPLGSPALTTTTMHHHGLAGSGEINVETMSQALRRTGSADLSGARSGPTSPIDSPSR